MMKIWPRQIVLSATICLSSLLVGCAGTPASAPSQADAAATVSEDATQCRQTAFERVRSLPAVRSGRTTYTQTGAKPYYETCMRERGHGSYPPY